MTWHAHSPKVVLVVVAASGYSGHGPNHNIDIALGGIIAAGAVYGR